MKRILTMIMAALFCLGFNANAQRNVKKTTTINKIASARAGDVHLAERSGIYFLILRSSNQFDKPFLLYLGEGKSAATQTLQDLQSVCDSIDESETMTIDNRGKDVRIRRGQEDSIVFHTDGFAGSMFITKAELNELLGAMAE